YGPVPRRHSIGFRNVEGRDWTVLLSWGSQGGTRPELFLGAASEAWLARRFRTGLRAGARDRASRAEPHWYSRKCAIQGQRQRTVGARRTASRLLRRRLWTRARQ